MFLTVKKLIAAHRFLFLIVSFLYMGGLFAQPGLVINEFLAANYTTLADDDFSAFSDWVEIANATNETLDISGFYLTDDFSEKQKWQFPPNTLIAPGEYLIIWCDEQDTLLAALHSNFRLSGGGEEIGIYDAGQNLVDTVVYPDQHQDISYGRMPEGSGGWVFFAEPTPGAANNTTGTNSGDRSPAVGFSKLSGFYEGPVMLSIFATGADEIRYTLDGSIPDAEALLYTDPLSLSANVVVNARSFSSGLLPGAISTASYFISEETTLPVVSMMIPPQFLWDTAVGIYVDEGIDLRRDWERRCTIAYFDQSHEFGFETEADIRLFGNSAIYYPQKSLAVFPDGVLEYPLFESRETNAYYSFLLRSSSDDWPYTMMRDALMQVLVEGETTLDVQAYEPAALFINGAYFGIHNIREKLNERYLATYHDVDKDDLDLVFMDLRDTTLEALSGDLVDIQMMADYLENNDMAQEENYAAVQEMMDVDNYIDYLIGNLFYSNTSWHHNVKVWKERVDGSKWQWLFYDLDRGMGLYYLNLYSVIEDLDTTDLFFPHLNQNESFRHQLLNTLSDRMNTTFRVERMETVIDSLMNRIAPEIPRHSLRWKDFCDPQGHCGVQSYAQWISDVAGLIGYAQQAPDKIREYMTDFYELEGTADLTILLEDTAKGKVYINGTEYKNSGEPWTYFKGIPLELTAEPAEGYTFLGWDTSAVSNPWGVSLDTDRTLTARFGIPCELPSEINEELVIGTDCGSYFTQGNVVIQEGASLTVEPGTFLLISPGDSIIVNGGLFLNGSNNEPVVLRQRDTGTNWGSIYGPQATIHLNHVIFNNSRAAVRIDGGELVMQNSLVQYSPYFYGDIVSVHHTSTILKNNTFYGPHDAGKTDVIDCDGISSGFISGNVIHGTTDDGIDIGEVSSGVTITGNTVYGCQSMGISIGEMSQALVSYNIVAFSQEAGIQVHTGAVAEIDHNTLYKNEVAIRAFHYDNEPQSGGHAIVTNSILAQSQSAVYESVDNSTLSFDYSISDTESISGTANLNEDPMLVNPEKSNFTLQESSPCIDSGDPEYPFDPDDTQTDMGALYFDHNNALINKNKKYQVLVFPNPASDYINCLLTDTVNTISELEVFNQQGQCVLKQHGNGRNPLRINTQAFPQGVYFLSLLNSQGLIIQTKFVVVNPLKK